MRKVATPSSLAAGAMAAGQNGRGLTAFVLLLALIAGAAAWWYYAPQSLPDVVRAIAPASPKSSPALYKWRDAKGRWNVTDVPPTDQPYETLKFNPNTNVVPSVVPPPLPKQ